MAQTDWLDDNQRRSYPFIAGTVGSNTAPPQTSGG